MRRGASGDDNVWFDVDPVPVPNGSLAKASYQVTAVTSKDGHNILGADHASNHLMIEGGLLRQPFLVIPIAANVADAELGSASVRFRFELPTKLTVFELTAADRDRPKEQDGIRVTLQRLERDVFAGKIQGGPARGASADDAQLRVHLFALDQTGRGLAFQQYSSTMFGFSGQFQGVVDKAGVVIEQEVREIVVDVDVDLHGGQPVSIPGEPSDDVPVRYRVEEPAQYLSTDPAALQGRTVEWIEPLREVWSHRLQLGLPETAGDVSSTWELNWFGRDKPLYLDGRESWTGPTGQRASSTCQWKPSDQERGLTPAHAVVGALRIVIPTNIRTLAFEKRADGEWLEQPVPDGGPLRVRFDKQIVTAALGAGRALDFRAYDAAGRSLKAGRTDPRRADDAQWYFWGQPARVELVVSFEQIDQTIPFEIVHREVDEAAYDQFKQTLNDEREVIRALQQIQQQMYRAYRPGDYDSIADFHFLHDRDGQPQRAVPAAVAHACPDAQARYGFQLTPFHGYYFGLITEFEQGGSRQPYGRSPTAVEQAWDGGRVAILGFTDRPVPAAWPVNPRQPSFLTVYRSVHAKLLDGARPEVFPRTRPRRAGSIKPTIDGPPP